MLNILLKTNLISSTINVEIMHAHYNYYIITFAFYIPKTQLHLRQMCVTTINNVL